MSGSSHSGLFALYFVFVFVGGYVSKFVAAVVAEHLYVAECREVGEEAYFQCEEISAVVVVIVKNFAYRQA